MGRGTIQRMVEGLAPPPPHTPLIPAIQTEEEAHLAWATTRRPAQTGPTRALYASVAATVEALIGLSTQGESGRLGREVDGRLIFGPSNPDKTPLSTTPPQNT